MEKRQYIKLQDLEVYKLARELSKIGWEIYDQLNWQDKKIMGDHFIEATDSIGANIAEGYKRFHYSDKIKFYYIARASLSECSEHWLELLLQRKKINDSAYKEFVKIATTLSVKLSNFITTTYKSKKDEQ